jgi:hypothetical protein
MQCNAMQCNATRHKDVTPAEAAVALDSEICPQPSHCCVQDGDFRTCKPQRKSILDGKNCSCCNDNNNNININININNITAKTIQTMPIGITPSGFVPATCEAELTCICWTGRERNAPVPAFCPDGLRNPQLQGCHRVVDHCHAFQEAAFQASPNGGTNGPAGSLRMFCKLSSAPSQCIPWVPWIEILMEIIPKIKKTAIQCSLVESSLVRAVSIPPSTKCSMGSGLGSTIELFIFCIPKDARILNKDGICPLHMETKIPGEKVGQASHSLVSQKTFESWMKMATVSCPACM